MASDIYNTGSAAIGGAANQGKDAINSFDPNAWANDTTSGLNSLWNNQNTLQGNYFQAYKDAIKANPSMTDLFSTAYDKFNVVPLQTTANTLDNAMLTAPNSNLAAAKGFNYDQNQVDQKTSQDLQRLAPAAAVAEKNAQTAETNASNYVTQGLTQNQIALLPIQEQGQYLMDFYARQQSGFTTVAQARLQALQDKMDQGVALSKEEMQEYASLASSEASYQGALASANATIKSAQIGNNFKILNPSQGLYSANTGQITPYNG